MPDLRPVQVEAVRLPPQSIDSEQSVLGALLLDNTAWDRVADVIREPDFYRADHRLIFRHIARLVEVDIPADVVTVAESLGTELVQAGGRDYLGSLAAGTPGVASIRRYAEIVRDRAVMRGLIVAGTELTAAAYNPGSLTAADMLERFQEELFKLTQRNASKGARPFREVLSKVVESIDERYHAGGGAIAGLPTGFVDLDERTAGFQPSDLVVIAGRPSMGKTALAMNIAEHVALDLKKSVAVFSLEMSDAQLVQRMLGSTARVNLHALRTGRLNEDDWERISRAARSLGDARIVIEETSSLAPGEMRAKARRLYRQNPDLGLIIVDYLQLMESGADKRVDQVAEITRGLKGIAKELSIPVIALSQLNRAVEQRSDKRPMMSDLRESGAIEQDADLILFMYRDEVYDLETPNRGVAEVIIGKQRNGPIGKVYLTFMSQYARFENFAGELQQKRQAPRSRPFESVRSRADVDG